MKELMFCFIEGMGEAFDFSPNAYHKPASMSEQKTDMEALRSDWDAICEDGHEAFRQLEEAHGA